MKLRATMKIENIVRHSSVSESLSLRATEPDAAYTWGGVVNAARWTPNAGIMIQYTNPDLIGTFAIGDVYVLDFERAEESTESQQ